MARSHRAQGPRGGALNRIEESNLSYKEDAMPDNKKRKGPPGNKRIDVKFTI